MINKVRYIDTMSIGHFHEQINGSLLYILQEAYKGKVVHYSSSSSCRNIENLLLKLDSSVNCHKDIFIPGGNGGFGNAIRFFYGALLNVLFLLCSGKDDLLFYNYNNPFSLSVVSFINNFLHRKIFIICHGELEYLLPHEKLGRFARILSHRVKSVFNSRINRKITFCVLGESIQTNLRPLLSPEVFSQFISVEHPYIYESSLTNHKSDLSAINIGVVGTFAKAKGADFFVDIVRKVKRTNIHFSIIGSINYDIDVLKSLGVSLPSNDGRGFLSVEEFDQRIQELDYILFLYPMNSYKLIASGAMFDAIKYKKPVIALKNDYFVSKFKIHGNFGILADSIENIIEMITMITEDNVQYDFTRIQKETSPQVVLDDFKVKLYNRFGL